jgi:hypothetical protein
MEERIKRGSKRTDRSGEIATDLRLRFLIGSSGDESRQDESSRADETRSDDQTRRDEIRRDETSRNESKHETRDIEIWNDKME